MSLELEILTPKEVLAKESSVAEVTIPASWGQMEILPQHTDYMTSLVQGELSYTVGSTRRAHNITGGLIVVKDGKATILADNVYATVTPIGSARSAH